VSSATTTLGQEVHLAANVIGALFLLVWPAKPDDAEAFYNRGIARYAKGDVEGAVQDYSEAIRLLLWQLRDGLQNHPERHADDVIQFLLPERVYRWQESPRVASSGHRRGLYGTTEAYGTSQAQNGTVYTLSVGLGPFVETQPTSGEVGETVEILGSNLTGATSVSFNGTAATFTVVSRYLITTTVPAGATT
jgi:hypothetical protein